MRHIFIAMLLLFPAITAHAGEIKNLTSGQIGDRGFVQYDLVGRLGEKEADVTVFLETGGVRYPAERLSLSGDFGKKVKVGKGKRFFWDFLKDFPAGFDGEVVWDVEASNGGVEPPKSVTSSASGDFTDRITGMEFVFVKGGCFQMGDTSGNGKENEKPVHEVCVEDFLIGKYEVTQRQWQEVMGSNPSKFKKCGPDCPVESISWNDAQNYIRKLNERSGKSYRLPTEAEWEYAARSGGKKEKFSGGDDIDAVAWYAGNSGSTTHPVGRKKANGLGIHDMSGNVWEWLSDRFDENYYRNSPRNNPRGPSEGTDRILRGGSWDYALGYARTARRDGGNQGVIGVDFYAGTTSSPYTERTKPLIRNDIGFRLAVPVP